MKVEFLQNKAGYAQIIIEDIDLPSTDAKDYSFSLQRSSDKTFMGRVGNNTWVNQEEILNLPCTITSNKVIFDLGPTFVNFINQGTYRLNLRKNNESLGKSILSIQDIQTEQLSASQALSDASKNNSLKSPLVNAQQIDDADIEKNVVSEPEPLIMDPITPKKSSKLPFIIIAILILLLLCGAGAWYFLKYHNSNEPEQTTTQTDKNENKQEEPQIKDDSNKKDNNSEKQDQSEKAKSDEDTKDDANKEAKDEKEQVKTNENQIDKIEKKEELNQGQSTSPIEQPVQLSIKERVRNFFADPNRQAEVAYSLSKEIDTKDPENQDILFRLLYFASQGNIKESYIEYARILDPTTPAFGTIKKDPVEAYEYYKKSDTEEAKTSMVVLENYINDEIAKGNPLAKKWLNSISK